MTTRLTAAVLLWAVGTAPAASPDPQTLVIPPQELSRARELVGQLGSDVFRDRDQASRKLAEMGRQALPALLEAARESDDAEVRMRCAVLLPRAEAEDMKAKVEVFLADADGKYDHDLPGWAKFRDLAGNDKSARELFAAMIKSPDNFEILIATRLPAEDIKRVVDARKRQMQFRMQQFVPTPNFQQRIPTFAEGAAVIFAECVAPDKEDGWNNGWSYHSTNIFSQTADAQQATRGQGKYGPAFRKLSTKWVETRDGVAGIQYALQIAQQIGLGQNELGKVYVKMLTVEGPNAQWQRGQALGHVARTNGKEHLAAVTKVFDDGTVLMQGGKQFGNQHEVLLKDFALVVALHLTGQKPEDYGLRQTPGHFNNQFHTPTMMHFPEDAKSTTEDKRTAAFAKWKDWEAKQKKDEPKKDEPKKK